MPDTEVLRLLETDRDRGLDNFEVRHRQQHFGPNVLTQKRDKSPLLSFLLQFQQPLVYILLDATVITAFLQEWVDAGVIFGVVLINAFIGFVQESKAVKALEALARSMESKVTVIKAGQKQKVSSTDPVPGDLLLFMAKRRSFARL